MKITDEQVELLPCPFCGMDVEIVTRPVSYGREFWYVYHPEHPRGECILEDSKFSSARGWNTRAPVAQSMVAQDADVSLTVSFGHGGVAVVTGHRADIPAVFLIDPPEDGVVGEKVGDSTGWPVRVALTFPTIEQAKQVQYALTHTSTKDSAQDERDAVNAIMQDVCEADRDDPDAPETVCIDVGALRLIVERHLIREKMP